MRPAVVRGKRTMTRGRTSNYTPTISNYTPTISTTTSQAAKPPEPEATSNTGVHIPTLTPAPWQHHAACRGIDDPEVFFPTDSNLPDITIAQAICAGCDVKTECLMWAFENNITHGIWGGLTEQQRFRMLGTNRRRYRRNMGGA